MAADLVPICLSLPTGDRYTVWAPRWRDAGDEWEAFLGKDDDLYGFETVADLVAFVRTDTDNDLVDHPAWEDLTAADAHTFDPAEDKQFDLVVVEELVAEKPTEESVTALAGALAIVSSIGAVCELAAVSKFFNGNPSLGTVSGGIDHFTGKAGHKRWNAIAEVIGRSWDGVLTAIDEIISTPDVDEDASAQAAEELAEEPEEPEGAEEESEGPEEEADGSAEEADGADAEDAAAADELEDDALETTRLTKTKTKKTKKTRTTKTTRKTRTTKTTKKTKKTKKTRKTRKTRKTTAPPVTRSCWAATRTSGYRWASTRSGS